MKSTDIAEDVPQDTASVPIVGIISPVSLILPEIKRAFAVADWRCNVLNLVDEALYHKFNVSGETCSDEIIDRIGKLIDLSIDAGADAIVFTGSLFGDAVRRARSGTKVPVLTSHESMIDEAISHGDRFLVLATVGETAEALSRDLGESAAAGQKVCHIKSCVLSEAFEALYLRNDRATHDRIIAEALNSAEEFDAILLGQFSMLSHSIPARIRNIPILNPIQASVDRLRMLVAAAQPPANVPAPVRPSWRTQ